MTTATMRVNVYAEALRPVDDDYGSRVYFRSKRVRDEQGNELPFPHHGICILVGDRVPHSDNKAGIDDDTAAVTFWYSDELQRDQLIKIFQRALQELNKGEARY